MMSDPITEAEPCAYCKGTGAVDAPFSGSDPCCPECDGEGTVMSGANDEPN